LSFRKTTIDKVIALDVNEEELVKRLKKRGETSSRSDDTDETVIRNRFAVYKNETEPVADYYQKQGKLEVIPGVGTIDNIFDAICSRIKKEPLAPQ
jgi:adenylate kinase